MEEMVMEPIPWDSDVKKIHSLMQKMITTYGDSLNIQMKELASSLVKLEIDKLDRTVSLRVINSNEGKMEDLVCSICKSFFMDPTTLACGHTFCKFCLEDDIMDNRNCLTCGSMIIGESKAPTFQLCNIISKCLPHHVEMGTKISNAKTLIQQGKFEEALDCLSVFKSSGSLNSNWLRCRADCNVSLEQFHLALSDIEKAVELCPMSVHILYRKARILLKLREFERAVLVLLRCVALQPENTRLREELESTLHSIFRMDHFTNENLMGKNLDLTRYKENHEKPMVVDEVIKETERPVLRLSIDSANGPSFEFPVNARDEFDCKLCCNLLFRPVTSPCGHTFCADCLQRSLDYRVDCPCCRTPLTKYLAERKKVVTRVIENIIKKLYPKEYNSRKEACEKELEEMKRVGESSEFEVPVFVCTLGFPSVPCPLHIFEPRYKLMIRRCIESGSRQFGMCAPNNDSDSPFATTGTMLKINDVAYLPDGRSLINTEGTKRFKVISHSMKDGYNIAKVKWLNDEVEDSEEEQLEIQRLNTDGYKLLWFWFHHLTSAQKECILNAVGETPQPEDLTTMNNDKPNWLWWALAALPLTDQPKLIILSMTSVMERLRSINRFLLIMIKMQQQATTDNH